MDTGTHNGSTRTSQQHFFIDTYARIMSFLNLKIVAKIHNKKIRELQEKL